MIISLIFGILGVIASILPIGLDLEENIGLHVLFGLRGVRKPPSDVVIVSLDKVSTDNLNLPAEPQKWPRYFHANLTESLAKHGAAVIVFDMMFDKPDTVDLYVFRSYADYTWKWLKATAKPGAVIGLFSKAG